MPIKEGLSRGRRKSSKPTDAEAIIKAERLAEILNMRLQGFSLTSIAQQQKLSIARVTELIAKALEETASEPAAQVRNLELARLDEMLTGIYEKAVNGDLFNVDRVLSIQGRRSRYLGLDKQSSTIFGGVNGGETLNVDPSILYVRILGDPEASRKVDSQPKSEVEVAAAAEEARRTVEETSKSDLE